MAHDLKLIYGPLFGFRVRTDGNKIFTRYGAILDDIERTCHYWMADGGIVRFPAYQVQKRDKPGAYSETKGGISACYDNRDKYIEDQRQAVDINVYIYMWMCIYI